MSSSFRCTCGLPSPGLKGRSRYNLHCAAHQATCTVVAIRVHSPATVHSTMPGFRIVLHPTCSLSCGRDQLLFLLLRHCTSFTCRSSTSFGPKPARTSWNTFYGYASTSDTSTWQSRPVPNLHVCAGPHSGPTLYPLYSSIGRGSLCGFGRRARRMRSQVVHVVREKRYV